MVVLLCEDKPGQRQNPRACAIPERCCGLLCNLQMENASDCKLLDAKNRRLLADQVFAHDARMAR